MTAADSRIVALFDGDNVLRNTPDHNSYTHPLAAQLGAAGGHFRSRLDRSHASRWIAFKWISAYKPIVCADSVWDLACSIRSCAVRRVYRHNGSRCDRADRLSLIVYQYSDSYRDKRIPTTTTAETTTTRQLVSARLHQVHNASYIMYIVSQSVVVIRYILCTTSQVSAASLSVNRIMQGYYLTSASGVVHTLAFTFVRSLSNGRIRSLEFVRSKVNGPSSLPLFCSIVRPVIVLAGKDGKTIEKTLASFQWNLMEIEPASPAQSSETMVSNFCEKCHCVARQCHSRNQFEIWNSNSKFELEIFEMDHFGWAKLVQSEFAWCNEHDAWAKIVRVELARGEKRTTLPDEAHCR